MTQPHPADADYTALNIPNEEALMAMADSALVLHETLSRQGRRQQTPEPLPQITDVPVFSEYLGIKKPNYSKALFDEAVDKAEAERGALGPVDSQMVGQFLSVLDEWMVRLRSLKAAESNAVMGHALNSIDLGRIGLKKVEGGEDGA